MDAAEPEQARERARQTREARNALTIVLGRTQLLHKRLERDGGSRELLPQLTVLEVAMARLERAE